jgi:phosphoribosylaminoimidazolecarboxamide formyltransferase/IMP cyclohydrolase
MSAPTSRRALLSVSDKAGLADLAKGLARHGYALISTGGTAKALRDAGFEVKDVSEETGFPEMMDGRVKTLHPKIHGALLALRDHPGHRDSMTRHDIRPIDLVVVNLYPFEATAARAEVPFEEVVEQIDIGGPAMVRSAAKNHRFVGVVTDPSQYPAVLRDLDENAGVLSEAMKSTLARAAFARTAAYDSAVSAWLAEGQGAAFPDRIGTMKRVLDLRYGENPHQRGALYASPSAGPGSLVKAKVLGGKELSFNNYGDADAAWALVREFAEPACVVVKHANPCGAAVRASVEEAYDEAVQCDPRSAFGGILAMNRPLRADLARKIAVPQRFFEVLIAPGVDAEAAAVFTAKDAPRWGASLRILDAGTAEARPSGFDVRAVDGGLLAQDRDRPLFAEGFPKVATKRSPDPREAEDLEFAFAVAKHTRSNAVVLAKDRRAVGVGAGQMSRVEATEIAIARARRWAAERGESLEGTVVASDAFYPFNDAIELALSAGATAVVHPGGSRNDAEAVALCDARGAAMWLSGLRHFRH